MDVLPKKSVIEALLDDELAPAKHTRSKQHLPDIPLDDFDKFLVQFDPDLRQRLTSETTAESSGGGDGDVSAGARSPTYQKWLRNLHDEAEDRMLHATPQRHTDDDDELNDPEYLYDDFEEVDITEVTHNRMTEIPRREVKELLADFCEAFNEHTTSVSITRSARC
jgi:hypothetical protein